MIEIYNLDCITGMITGIKDESVDLVLTDPPYLINYKTGHRKNKNHRFCSEIKNDGKENVTLLDSYFKECYRVLKNNSAIYTFCSWKTDHIFRELLINAGFTIKNKIIWVKNNHTAGDLTGQFGQKYEVILLAVKGKPKIRGERIQDVWHFNRVSGKTQLHQNQKPVDLLELCIRKHSDIGNTVFDGFMGSGSTAIAAMNLKRNFIGFELDREYFKMAEERIENNKKA